MSSTTTIRRHAFEVELEPLLGSTFQPTGFPDLGAATFDRPVPGSPGTTTRCMIVESVQSMANRLEATGWDDGAHTPVEAITGLPYVEVRSPAGEFLTSSRLEPHRLFSAYVRDAQWNGRLGDQVLVERLGLAPDVPLDYQAMAAAVMAMDPLSLLHGVFFAGSSKVDKKRGTWHAQPRFTRAVSAVIEASDVYEVASGGRKSDIVRHSLGDGTDGGAAEGYGSVPFHRMEYTAATIQASFVVDVQLLASYGLPQAATDLLETLALWEIRQLLDGGLRLRTACDLVVKGEITTKTGTALPSADELATRLRTAIDPSADVLGEGKAISVVWEKGKK
ncbi:MAG: type CRISPR-associated protein Csb1/Cas7u [Actinomycetota bacterium]|nr:type CRISPR-associated protein Csb1/Cas7u [Actinomycetota bacterium]